METVLIVIHLMIVIALVGVVLLQRSEGGALGMGGGGTGGFMSARGAADALTRTTGILAAAFFATSIGLGLIARYGESPTDILDRVPAQVQQDGETGEPASGSGVLDLLGAEEPAAPATDEAPAVPAVPTE
ncbi:preprotein translocase subunit SecG [Oricola thermophila]|uniref:Protein-export membrane protein SecG n=1 Tax=Oricola thermophila TaxID=2742145 RepID=A0A6N1VB32_9HYPH|nr:preprotein translocase subunit SecG [Oricola thermophila]QKV18120.1 preprotein translocase subunit SecG [Oricola thermophila]